MKAGARMVGQFERNKDTVQEITESVATHVGNIAKILGDAVVRVAREVGDTISDAIEMREAAERAREDEERSAAAESDAESDAEPDAGSDAGPGPR